MRSSAALLPLILLAACDGNPSGPAPAPGDKGRAGPAAAAGEPQVDRAAREAAGALRHYYGRIEAGDYAAAYRLRTPGGASFERFAANFRAYESYRTQLGAPAGPVAQDGFDYVEVPVMTTGRFVGGKPFGTSGRVMLRRARDGGDRHWYVLAL
jgi:hypothetical protein